MDLHAEITRQRHSLLDALEGLTQEQWDTMSLCRPWTVHQVLAHMVSAFERNPRLAFTTLKGVRSVDDWFERLAIEIAANASGPELMERLRAKASSRYFPALLDGAPYNDIFVHGGDIRRVLGIAHHVDPETVLPAFDFVTKHPIGRRVSPTELHRGYRFEATDVDWTHGSGEQVTGTAIDLLMALTGRSHESIVLEGPGAAAYLASLPNAGG